MNPAFSRFEVGSDPSQRILVLGGIGWNTFPSVPQEMFLWITEIRVSRALGRKNQATCCWMLATNFAGSSLPTTVASTDALGVDHGEGRISTILPAA